MTMPTRHNFQSTHGLTSSSVKTIPSYVVGSELNRLAIGLVDWENNVTLDSAVLNGVACSLGTAEDVGNQQVNHAFLVNPAAGTGDWNFTFSATARTAIGGLYAGGARQTSQPDVVASNQASSATVINQALTTDEVDCLILSTVIDSAIQTTITVSGHGTALLELPADSSNNLAGAMAYHEAASIGTYTVTVTASPTSGNLVSRAIAIAPVVAAGDSFPLNGPLAGPLVGAFG